MRSLANNCNDNARPHGVLIAAILSRILNYFQLLHHYTNRAALNLRFAVQLKEIISTLVQIECRRALLLRVCKLSKHTRKCVLFNNILTNLYVLIYSSTITSTNCLIPLV